MATGQLWIACRSACQVPCRLLGIAARAWRATVPPPFPSDRAGNPHLMGPLLAGDVVEFKVVRDTWPRAAGGRGHLKRRWCF